MIIVIHLSIVRMLMNYKVFSTFFVKYSLYWEMFYIKVLVYNELYVLCLVIISITSLCLDKLRNLSFM